MRLLSNFRFVASRKLPVLYSQLVLDRLLSECL
jgi:hypothetical protein